ncbi:MAG: hypothetical protein AAFW98_17565, partial [Pseudomonadota bacterium]
MAASITAALVLASFAAGAAPLGYGMAGNAPMAGVILVDEGEVSAPVSEAPATGVVVGEDPSQRCAAIAVASDGVAEGGGRGPTLEAARADALK